MSVRHPAYRRKIIIEATYVTGNRHCDFPLLVDIVADGLRFAKNGGHVAQAHGEDVFFTDSNGISVLDHEIESYDPATGALRAWVRLPSLRGDGSTVLYICYGIPVERQVQGTRVWDKHYRMVLHLDETTDIVRDATSHANDTTRPAESTPSACRRTRAEVKHSGSLNIGSGITVEAWVQVETSQAEALQALVSKWTPGTSFTAFSAYDAGDTDGLDSKGFLGATFDGRYVYFVPQANTTLQENGTRRHGIVLRYDTHGDFKEPRCWQAYDAGNTDGLNTKGYYGGVFDGRYVYFVPRYDGTDYHSRVLRYDTRGDFHESASWSAYDAGLPVSYQSAGFDGRYIYFCPGHRPDHGELERDKQRYNTATSEGGSGEVLRYDTAGDFKEPGSWTVYDAAGTSGLDTCYFDGAVFDGTYMYFVPLYHKAVLRYDTRKPFAEGVSWRAFDANYLGMDMCVGAVFDGQHIYFVPYSNDCVVRYDTFGGFIDRKSWNSFRVGDTEGLNVKGWDGAAFDGRHIYFIPFLTGGGSEGGPELFHGEMLRYDTTKAFVDQNGWSLSDAIHTDGLETRGYNGGAFDGRYLYCAAWQMGKGETTNISGHGNFLRYDTLGKNGSFSLRYADCGHNGGLCAALPGPTFLVNTERGAVSARANKMPPPGAHHLAGVYDGKRIRLFIDGVLMDEQAGNGGIQCSDVDVAIGHIQNGLGYFPGRISEARISDIPRSSTWLATQYANQARPETFLKMSEEEPCGGCESSR